MRPNTQLARIYKRQQGRCCWCGKNVGPLLATIEHIIPRSFGPKNGGSSCYDNKAMSHMSCNSERGNDVTRQPHEDRIFDFVRQRLLAARKFYVAPAAASLVHPKPKPIPAAMRIDWTCIILRTTPMGWVGMAASMRKSGRADKLRVTPPYKNRVIALADITGAIR